MPKPIVPPRILYRDLTGLKNNRWTVIEHAGKSASGANMWLCKCECGTLKKVSGTNVSTGKSKSCGCYKSEVTSKLFFKHGLNKTPEYIIWCGMRSRCNDADNKLYGGRGIAVCARWDDFLLFFSDIGKRPSSKHSIERRDNDGDYTPDNCYWATQKEQQRNKSSNHMISAFGVSMTMVEWSEFLAINYFTLRSRINICGWSAERSLLAPILKHPH